MLIRCGLLLFVLFQLPYDIGYISVFGIDVVLTAVVVVGTDANNPSMNFQAHTNWV